MHSARILADSISEHGHRLTTFELCFPRIVLAEHNTHRQFSRNSASSRAIPIERMLRMVQDNPYVPSHWGKNQKGMQAAEEILGADAISCEEEWLRARDQAVDAVKCLLELGLHKQTTNRSCGIPSSTRRRTTGIISIYATTKLHTQTSAR